jgi:hypothetical protein
MNWNDDLIVLREAIVNPDFISIAIFCALGSLLMLNMLLRLSDLSAFQAECVFTQAVSFAATLR